MKSEGKELKKQAGSGTCWGKLAMSPCHHRDVGLILRILENHGTLQGGV